MTRADIGRARWGDKRGGRRLRLELVSQAHRDKVSGVIGTATQQDGRGRRTGAAMRAATVLGRAGDAKRRILEKQVRVTEIKAYLLRIFVGGDSADKDAVAVGNQNIARAILDRRCLVAYACAQQHAWTIRILGAEGVKPAVTIVEIEHFTDAGRAATRANSGNILQSTPILPF